MFRRATIEALRRGERRIKRMNDCIKRTPLLGQAQGNANAYRDGHTSADWYFVRPMFHRDLNFPKLDSTFEPYKFYAAPQ